MASRSENTVVICGGNPRIFLKFRMPIIRELLARGVSVVAIGDKLDAEVVSVLAEMGVTYHAVSMSPTSLNVLSDLSYIWKLSALLRSINPDVFFGYSMKPALYGALSARLAKVRRSVVMLEGLGYAFTGGGEARRTLSKLAALFLMRTMLPTADQVIVLNSADEEFVSRLLKLRGTRVCLVEGIGINLENFHYVPLPAGPLTCLFVGRLLADKGLPEFVRAAALVKAHSPSTRFQIAGPIDPNPSGWSKAELQPWLDSGTIEYLGELSDVRPALAKSHVLVLPSYREGFPVVSMEAAAMGRAVVTTDAPGCRDSVIPGATGLIVPAREAHSLADAILRLERNRGLVDKLGRAGRQLAINRFSDIARSRELANLILK